MAASRLEGNLSEGTGLEVVCELAIECYYWSSNMNELSFDKYVTSLVLPLQYIPFVPAINLLPLRAPNPLYFALPCDTGAGTL